MLRWHHCSSLNPIVHCLSSPVFLPWAPGQWEEKVTVNIALKSSLPPIELLKMEQATSGWALPSCAGHFNCKTSNKYESFNVAACCSEIICSVLTLITMGRSFLFVKNIRLHDIYMYVASCATYKCEIYEENCTAHTMFSHYKNVINTYPISAI